MGGHSGSCLRLIGELGDRCAQMKVLAPNIAILAEMYWAGCGRKNRRNSWAEREPLEGVVTIQGVW